LRSVSNGPISAKLSRSIIAWTPILAISVLSSSSAAPYYDGHHTLFTVGTYGIGW
jgi:hypothetical protein